MSKLSAGLLIFTAVCAARAAHAADLPSPRLPPAPVLAAIPVYNWAGAYAGLGVGQAWATAPQTFSISSATLASLPPIIPVIDGAGSQRISLRGSIVEADAGYNWQLQNWIVVGVEGDVSWTGLSGSQSNGGAVPNLPAGSTYSIYQRSTIDGEGSLRARAGVTPAEGMLVYLTGGPALAQVHYTSAFNDVFSEREAISTNAWKLGWTVGAGVEYAFGPNWTVKAEYTHSEFEASKASGSTILTDGTTAYAAHSTGTPSEDAVRVGVNYHFD